MKHLLHLVGWDVRRFRLLLSVWLLVEVVDAAFTGVRPALVHDPSLARMLALLDGLLFLSRWLGVLVIVPLVVQAHPLVGSEAFWLTRPIPWHTLFASKVLLLGMALVAVPAVCEVVLMAVYRVPIAQIALVSLQTILLQALWLFIVMAFAAVTLNLAGFALVIGGVLVGLVLLPNIVLALMIRSMTQGPQLTEVTIRTLPSATAPLVMLLLVLIAAVAPLVIQYRTRFTRAAIAAGVLGVVVAVLAMVMWPSAGRPVPVPAWAAQDSALRLAAASPIGEFSRFDSGLWDRFDTWRIGSVRLRLSGVERGWIGTARLVDATARFADGTTLRTAENGQSAVVPFASIDDVPSRAAVRDVLGVSRLWDTSQGRARVDVVPGMLVSQADFTKHSAATAIYRGRFLLDLDHVQVLATLPLAPGADYHDPRRRVLIEAVLPQTQAAVIRVRHVTATAMFDANALHPLSFYLRNRVTAEAVAGSMLDRTGMATGLAFPLFFGGVHYSTERGNGFNVTSDVVRFPEPYTTVESVVDISATWLSQAELVLVQTVPAGSVTRTVEIPRFELRPTPITAP